MIDLELCPWCGAEKTTNGDIIAYLCGSCMQRTERDMWQSAECSLAVQDKQIEKLTSKLEELRTENAALDAEVERLSAENAELEAEIERLQAIIDEQRKQNEDWQQKILSLDETIERLTMAVEMERGHRQADKQEARDENERLTRERDEAMALVEKLQAGNRAEALVAARQLYREGRFEGTPLGAEILKSHPWLKEREGEG